MRLKSVYFFQCLWFHYMNISVRSPKYYKLIIVPNYINCMIISLSDQIRHLTLPIPRVQISPNTPNNNIISIMTPSQTSHWNPNQNPWNGLRHNIILLSTENIYITSKISNNKFRSIFIKTYTTICYIETILGVGFLGWGLIVL